MLRQFWGCLTVIGIGFLSCPAFTAPMTPRQAFYYHAQRGNLTALIQLKKMGYHIDVSDDYGNSALCEAVIKKDNMAIQTLIQAGADTNATCMQALSGKTSQNAPQQAPVMSGEVNQQERLASPAATKVPNPPAEPLSKNTKVGIGLGITTLAAAGTTVAILASGGGGGGSSHLNCVDGVQDGKSCRCNPHAIGKLCDSCEEGYGMHGTNSCHADKTCGTHAQQIGDECVCEKGYDFQGEDGNCYKDLRCSQIYVHMHQENGNCVCDSGYNQYSQSGYATNGCYEDLHCDTSKHFVQVNNACLCEADYPVEEGGVCKSCSEIDPNSEWNGSQCVCKSTHPAKEGGLCKSCSEIKPNSEWNGSQCVCKKDYSVEYKGACYTKLSCVHGTQTGDYCTCPAGEHWSGQLCDQCESPYILNAGKCKSPKGGDLKGRESTHNTNLGGITINNTEMYDNIYGLYNPDTSYSDTQGAKNGNSGITIENESNANVYGIHGNLNRSSTRIGDTFGAYTENVSSNNQINITNEGIGNIYGIYAKGPVYGAYLSNATNKERNPKNTITITDKNSNTNTNIYGLYSSEDEVYGTYERRVGSLVENYINITNTGHATVYGIWGISNIWNTYAHNNSESKSYITITNTGNGNIYGMYGLKKVTGVYDLGGVDENSKSESKITITNTGTGTVYGMYGKDLIGIDINHNTQDKNTITITSKGGNAYGMYAKENLKNTSNNSITIDYQSGDGNAYGIFAETARDNSFENQGPVTITGSANKAYGIYVAEENGQAQNIKNGGNINVSGKNAYGIFVRGTNTLEQKIVNNGDITVSGTNAIGIYVKNGGNTKITNSGDITITGTDAYGIYVSNATGNTEIDNTGTIKINGVEDDVYRAVVKEQNPSSDPLLTTMSLYNSGLIASTSSLNLSSFDGKVIARSGSTFSAKESISGLLNLDSGIVTQGFDTTYIEKAMIDTGDTTGLNLISESALFDAKLADNGKDVVMTMKSFDTATSNKSLANFLSKNYALGNNEAFFNKLKSFGNMGALTDSLNKLTGRDMLSRFNFEDMTMMRELNFDMNEKLFHNKEQHFALAGSVSPMAFKGDTGSNARYSLFNKRDGNKSIGLGIAFTDVRSDDTHEDNDRYETSYQLILPLGYKAGGFNLVTSPRIGYARGTYDRTGFDNTSYDGTIEKRVFGLMNEARYPITVGKWKLEPSAEFNILGYQQKGHEDAKEFALNIQSQNTLSVEGGIGLYATREEELDKDTTLKLTAGVAAYHEFADPYRVKVGMNGMDGAFTLRDEKRSDNRSVIRAGFDYAYRDLSLYGSLISYIDREARTSAKTGMRVKF